MSGPWLFGGVLNCLILVTLRCLFRYFVCLLAHVKNVGMGGWVRGCVYFCMFGCVFLLFQSLIMTDDTRELPVYMHHISLA